MSNMKHTKGPWKIRETLSDEGDFIITTDTNMATSYHIAQVWNVNGYVENTGNAKMIAASPELLAALELIANTLSPNVLPVNGMMASYDHALMVREEADRCFEIARAAIAKATQP